MLKGWLSFFDGIPLQAKATMLTSTLLSPLPSAAAFADLASIAVEQDQTSEQAERRVRAVLRAQERWASRRAAKLLGVIEGMIGSERQGELALTEEELTALIDDLHASETELRSFLRSVERAFRRLAGAAARDSKDRHDSVCLAGREFVRILSRYIAAIQEGRWMLMGIRDGREPRDGGTIIATPQELGRLLTIS